MQNNTAINWLSWLFLALNLTAAYLISQIDGFQLWFLVLLLFDIVLGFAFAKRINTSVLHISRVLVGVLFIYSGFVKGVDPLGTQFRIEIIFTFVVQYGQFLLLLAFPYFSMLLSFLWVRYYYQKLRLNG